MLSFSWFNPQLCHPGATGNTQRLEQHMCKKGLLREDTAQEVGKVERGRGGERFPPLACRAGRGWCCWSCRGLREWAGGLQAL